MLTNRRVSADVEADDWLSLGFPNRMMFRRQQVGKRTAAMVDVPFSFVSTVVSVV